MKSFSRQKHRNVYLLLGLLVQAFLLWVVIYNSHAFAKLDLDFYDALLNREIDERADWLSKPEGKYVKSPVVMIAIDDGSIQDLGGWPFSRDIYAQVLKNLEHAGAKWIGFDIVFDTENPTTRVGDSLFAYELGQVKNVTLAGKIQTVERWYEHSVKAIQMEDHIRPIQRFLDKSASPWGAVNMKEDIDNAIRELKIQNESSNGSPILSFAYSVLAGIGNLNNNRNLNTWAKIPFVGKQNPFVIIPIVEILDDSSFKTRMEKEMEMDVNLFEEHVSSGILKDKIVLVGAYSEHLHDIKLSPVGHIPGAELHAHVIAGELMGRSIHQLSQHQHFILAWLLSALGLTLGVFLRPRYGLLLPFILIGGFVVICDTVFQSSLLYIPVSGVLTASVSMLIGVIAIYLRLENLQKSQVTKMFGQYLPEAIVKELIKDPNKARLGGERRYLTVIFTDIKGFTSISELLPPEKLTGLLNEYLTAMTDTILSNKGIVDKYIGDAIVAEFGIPFPIENSALAACKAAVAMQNTLKGLREKWTLEGDKWPSLVHQMEMRVGIATGDMTFGNMGSNRVFDYTVIGDRVNFGARLESANKQYGTNVMIDENTYNDAGNHILARHLDMIVVKGKTLPMKVFNLITTTEFNPSAETIHTVKLFDEGVALYRNREFNLALEKFSDVLKIWTTDEPSRKYIQRCEDYIQNPPPPNWNGVKELKEK